MRNFLGRFLVALVLAGAAWRAGPAAAGWTVVAADPATGEVGVAGATCDSSSMIDSAALAPGHGAAAAQGQMSERNRDRVWQLLQRDTPPADILATVTGPASDKDAAARQYGIATTGAGAGIFTGSKVTRWAGGLQRSGPEGVVTVQGGDLAGGEVLQRALDAYFADDQGPLAMPDRLMRALEAGSAASGDRRCNEDGITQTARSAFLLSARGTDPPFAAPAGRPPEHIAGKPWLALSVVNALDRGNPLIELREEYDAWRTDNLAPCPECNLTPVEVPEGDRAADPPLDSNQITGLVVVGAAAAVILTVGIALAVAIMKRRRLARTAPASGDPDAGGTEPGADSPSAGTSQTQPLAEADSSPG